MSARKRSAIQPERLRKVVAGYDWGRHDWGRRGWAVPGKLLLAGSGAAFLSGCSQLEQGHIYKSVQDCTFSNPGMQQQCKIAYQQAMSDWRRTAPRYRKLQYCEQEFGRFECENDRHFYRPVMAAFMLYQQGERDGYPDLDFDSPRGLTSSRQSYSSLKGKWLGADGQTFGKTSQAVVPVKKRNFRPLKGSSRVLGRGGFGRTVASVSRGS